MDGTFLYSHEGGIKVCSGIGFIAIAQCERRSLQMDLPNFS
jgi:hypothetical protein